MSGVVLPADQPAPLAGVALLLGDEPAVRAASGGQGESVAVGDAARPLFLAALARTSARRPTVVAVPTATEAERIAHDLRQLLGAGAVELFPAWETLPFERVSPSVETMGQRNRVRQVMVPTETVSELKDGLEVVRAHCSPVSCE